MLRITTTRRQRKREDDAWSDGYHTGDEEVDDFIAGKDAFIAKQSDLIVALVEGDHIKWGQLPEELRNQLADYA